MASPLEIYTEHVEAVDEKFDDDLIYEYQHYGEKPIFKITYDETSEQELRAALPQEWLDMEKNGKIIILLCKFSTESEEYQRSKWIVDVVLRKERKKLMNTLRGIPESN